MRDLLAATSNPHKLDELRAIFSPLGFRVLSLADVGPPGGGSFPEPVEDGETFEANASKKAVAYARMTGRPCLADDSGLVVDALGGEPGVHSAYWAGVGSNRAERDAANNKKLIEALRDVPRHERAARFVCVMALARPDAGSRDGARVLATTRGEFEGRITDRPRGSNGFGYDPLLEFEDGRTSAELSEAEKNARSHRGRAARAMAQTLTGHPEWLK
ncbi:MAG TPA: RdgB/HAM1 family non-canonical purine NTP pyrophosphatase [Phycisphaerales bacterium]|nr:RdgB/HAM1 family non-canonical purine NTP pyrophosphatase [Phycisphaerales bacterium]